jgi:hypothetical protein
LEVGTHEQEVKETVDPWDYIKQETPGKPQVPKQHIIGDHAAAKDRGKIKEERKKSAPGQSLYHHRVGNKGGKKKPEENSNESTANGNREGTKNPGIVKGPGVILQSKSPGPKIHPAPCKITAYVKGCHKHVPEGIQRY